MLCTLPAFYTVQPCPTFLEKVLSTAMTPQAADPASPPASSSARTWQLLLFRIPLKALADALP